jgi:CRISPR-associated exonuclease Cas4
MRPSIILVVVAAGLFLWLVARLGRQASGIPAGAVRYSDAGHERTQEKALYSKRYQLAGRPDYVVQKDGQLIPVEVKSGRGPKQPYKSHVLQLAAYCLLVEEVYGRRPPYGIIRYADCMFEVDYTQQVKQELLAVLREMRASVPLDDVPRSHNQAARCARCGYRNECDQSLVAPGVGPAFEDEWE